MQRNKSLTFSQDALEILRDAKNQSGESLTKDHQSVLIEAAELLKLSDPEMLGVYLEPILNKVDNEESLVLFFKLILSAYRLSHELDKLEEEVAALDLILNESGPFALATVNFNELEVFEKHGLQGS